MNSGVEKGREQSSHTRNKLEGYRLKGDKTKGVDNLTIYPRCDDS